MSSMLGLPISKGKPCPTGVQSKGFRQTRTDKLQPSAMNIQQMQHRRFSGIQCRFDSTSKLYHLINCVILESLPNFFGLQNAHQCNENNNISCCFIVGFNPMMNLKILCQLKSTTQRLHGMFFFSPFCLFLNFIHPS